MGKKSKEKPEEKRKMGRPPTKPVTKRPAYYVNVKVSNSMNYVRLLNQVQRRKKQI